VDPAVESAVVDSGDYVDEAKADTGDYAAKSVYFVE